MKNPFEKNDHKVLIAGIVIGSLAAGAAAYLFLTETGKEVRGQLSGHFNRLRDTFLGHEPEAATADETPSYLQHKNKAPKTDREALKNNEILHQAQPGSAEDIQEQQS
ncbi:YtxH domain-containing protein [Mucilaginibacter sp. CAU 1740]|uniref:YtxH domain-containing protein n=1 Tax=Mucilaginibacter sp. CAU 1740 TaxID=3140365 RepID=UPI00325AC439